MGRSRIYGSAAERLRAWRRRKMEEKIAADRVREQEERACRAMHESEFGRLWEVMIDAAFHAKGFMPEVQGEAIQAALQEQRPGLLEAYCWKRRFPEGGK